MSRFGSIAWVASIQFFAAQIIVQSVWTTPFSLATNYISDLGNTVCAPYPRDSGGFVCSPWHAVMNTSFVLVGLTTLLGAVFVRGAFGARRWSTWGLALIAIAGVGFMLVGLFPENINLPPHKLGAGLQFVCGNLAQVLLGVAIYQVGIAPRLATWSIASGAVGLLATALFVSGHMLGLGLGGMERLAAYPLPIWCIVMGLWLGSPGRLRGHHRGSFQRFT